ncbi:hypothetical protein RBH29_16470 [Herbivorax sp. ANBcel31]|nr:hypothetical protein [Herbivorax sp. ANBcel31]MDQ2088025.1 hypothetical protein [Herbivorax sp. ANBcel31]
MDKKLNVDVIVPMSPSKKDRGYQPVDVIAEELANKLGVYHCFDYLSKI